MNELENIEVIDVKSIIYAIRGKQVILDSDVARLYNYETKRINETVKRNIARFPTDFYFNLTYNEYEFLKSQIATSKNKPLNTDNRGGKQKLPYVFTEKGIIMLAGLLKNKIAIEISLNIVEAFVEMRKFISNNAHLLNRLTTVEYKLLEQDKRIDTVLDELHKDENIKQKIFYEGQIYDAYSLIIDIISKAKKEIVIIDNYIDKSILDLLTKKNNNVNVTIIGNNKLQLSNLDITKFNEQYAQLKIKLSDKYHDRFIIIDNDIIYHLGASLKDLGKKTFAINVINDKSLLNNIIKF